MEEREFQSQIARFGVIPVIAVDDPRAALPLADALIKGGLPVAEVTFRTAAAAEVIATLARQRPALLVGAGTVLTRQNLEAAEAAGARFCVAPGLNVEIVKCAQQAGIPFVPGVATPTEVEQALALGCTLLKFFPAETLGGVKMLEALHAPYQHMGVKFVPTGGVNPANLESYLRCKSVAAVGGTWIAKKEDIASGSWEDVRQRCQAAREILSRTRPKPQ